MTNKIYLTWADFDEAVFRLSLRVRHVGATSIHGVCRGGLPLAVAISNRLDIPMYLSWFESDQNMFVVDEIVDSGITMGKFLPYFSQSMLGCWFRRSTCKVPVWAVKEVPTSDWLVFPWEVKDKADADQADYEQRRKG